MKTINLIFFIFLFVYQNSELSIYFKNSTVFNKIKLSNELYEISGITVDDDGNFFGHNDEEGIVHQIDLQTGKTLSRILIAKNIIYADFEDIAYANGYFYLITSSGKIYSFNKKRKDFSYKIYNTELSEKNNCEGLMYERKTNSLLIACKDYPGKNLNGFRAIYQFSLKTKKLNSKPFLLINLKELKKHFAISQFHPSAIAHNEFSNSYFILSAKGKPAIIEILSSGKIIDAKLLDTKLHPKPEGIIFNKEKLLISDEGFNSPAFISIYSK